MEESVPAAATQEWLRETYGVGVEPVTTSLAAPVHLRKCVLGYPVLFS